MEKRRFGLIGIFIMSAAMTLLTSGCIDHHFLYKFDLAGDCDFSYTARGDSLDMYTPPDSYPEEPFFSVTTRKETDSTGTETFILEAHRKFRGDSLPSTLGLKSVPWVQVFLQHPAKLTRTPLFFASIYSFEGLFKGRNRTRIEGSKWGFIPEECRVLEEDADSVQISAADRAVLEEKYAAGMLKWNEERYKRRIREILTKVQALHPDITVPPEWIQTALTEADSVIHHYAEGLQFEELDLADLEWWNDLAPQVNLILSENLNVIGDSTLKAEIVDIGKLLEMRHQVTEDLMDESFEVRVDLPGRVLRSDSKAMDTGVLIWKFEGEELADDDVNLSAFSVYLFANRIVGVLVLALAVFLAIKLRSPGKGEEKQEPVEMTDHDSIPPMGHG